MLVFKHAVGVEPVPFDDGPGNSESFIKKRWELLTGAAHRRQPFDHQTNGEPVCGRNRRIGFRCSRIPKMELVSTWVTNITSFVDFYGDKVRDRIEEKANG